MLTGYKFCHENIKRSFFWEFLPLSFGYRDKFSQSFSLTEKKYSTYSSKCGDHYCSKYMSLLK